MGLDIYVGSLTRYYSKQWETVIQRWARENGRAFRFVGKEPAADEVTDPAEVEPAVCGWREMVSHRLTASLTAALAWREGMHDPYFTDKPDWDGWGATLLWAAHAEMPSHPLPDLIPKNCFNDPLFHAWQSRPEATFLRGVLMCEWWLPGNERFVFEMEDVAGRKRMMGFTRQLHEALQMLNEMSWKASTSEVEAWRAQDPPEPAEDFAWRARNGFSIASGLAKQALEHQLPMLLDY